MISSRKHTWWGSSRPGVPSPWVSTGLWPVRTRTHSRRLSGRPVNEASSVFTATPHCLHYRQSSASCQIRGGIINVKSISHSEIIPSPSVGKTVFHKASSWCPNCWGLLVQRAWAASTYNLELEIHEALQFRFLTWILSIHTQAQGCDFYQKNHKRHSSSSSFSLSTNTSLEITSCLLDQLLFISI